MTSSLMLPTTGFKDFSSIAESLLLKVRLQTRRKGETETSECDEGLNLEKVLLCRDADVGVGPPLLTSSMHVIVLLYKYPS